MKSIIPAFLFKQDIFDYGDSSAASKAKFHAEGKKFLKAFASEVGLAGACDIRSSLGGPGVLGEVILHADGLYMQLFESMGPGVRVLYRSCKGRKDSSGGNNMYVAMKDLQDEDALARFIATCTRIAQAVPA